MAQTFQIDNPLAGRQSSPQLIAEALREAIIQGKLTPDQPLRQELLAQHFSVSRIPLREALRQLESEGWIVFQTNRGARVSGMSASEVREIYEIRASLECTALKLAAAEHTRESWKDVAKFLRSSRRETQRSRYVQRNRDFHLALYGPAQRPQLMNLIDSLHARGERYLRLKLEMPVHKRQSDSEHKQIYEACRRGEVKRATQVLEAHLLQTGEMVAQYLSRDAAVAARK